MILIARIRQLVQSLFDFVQKDFNSLPETQTFLYQMFWGLQDGSFNFYNQARDIFLRTNTSPRKVTVLMEYPKDKAHFPCVVVRESNKSPKFTPFGGIGGTEPFGVPQYQREGFTTFTSSKIDLMCISHNFLESVLLGETLYALLEGARNTLEQEFVNFEFSMSEIIVENQLFPTPIVIKNISIMVDEESRFASLLIDGDDIVRSIRFEPDVQCPYNCSGGGADIPDEDEKRLYFEFAYPYVWLRKNDNSGENEVFSNTDWKLYIGETEYPGNVPAYPGDKDYFRFTAPYTWLDSNNQGEQGVESNTDWKLE